MSRRKWECKGAAAEPAKVLDPEKTIPKNVQSGIVKILIYKRQFDIIQTIRHSECQFSGVCSHTSLIVKEKRFCNGKY